MTTTANSTGVDEAQASFVSVFLNGYLAYRERQRQRRASAHQSALNDHALRDIGLDRFEISPAASAAHSRRKRRHARA